MKEEYTESIKAWAAPTRAGKSLKGRLVDSGASRHITSDRTIFRGIVRRASVPVVGIEGEGGGLVATGVGRGEVVVDGVIVELDRVYYVPGLGATLLSVSEIVNAGNKIVIELVRGTNTLALHTREGDIAFVESAGGLYNTEGEGKEEGKQGKEQAIWEEAWDGEVLEEGLRGCAMLAGKCVGNTYTGDLNIGELVHQRLSHLSWGNGPLAGRLREVYGKKAGQGCTNASCAACIAAKMEARPRRAAPERPATRPLERVHFDGVKVPCEGGDGSTGFILLVDECTGMVFKVNIKSKSETGPALELFKREAEKHFREEYGKTELGKVMIPFELAGLRSDSEQCNKSNAIKAWCQEHGIKQEFSSPHCQWQDGRVERIIKAVWEGSEAMRKHAGAPPALWPYALSTAVYVRNKLALRADEERSPYELWHGVTIPIKNRLKDMRIWGSKCYVYIPKALRMRFDDHCAVCVFLGYSDASKAYMAMDLRTGRILTSPNVVFDETRFPLRSDGVRAEMVTEPEGLEEQMRDCFKEAEAADNTEYVETRRETYTVQLGEQLGETENVEPRGPPEVGEVKEAKHDVEGPDEVTGDEDETEVEGLEQRGVGEAQVAKRRGMDVVDTGGARTRTGSGLIRLRRRPEREGLSERASVQAEEAALQRRARRTRLVVVARNGAQTRAGPSNIRMRREPIDAGGAIVAMRARLATVKVPHVAEDGGIRQCGQVEVPQLNKQAAIKFRLASRLENEAMSAKTKARVGRRIELLAMVVNLQAVTPATHAEAVGGRNAPAWQRAMDAELGNMSDFGVWKMAPLPPGEKAIGCKWVFAIKRSKIGEVIKLKARLVLKGFLQRPGLDFDETWAPTCRLRSFRFMMAEAAQKGMRTAQFDSTAAFLQSDMDRRMFMRQPPGFERGDGVCQLLKCIYGSRQASRQWYGKLNKAIMDLAGELQGCTVVRAEADRCLYTIRRGKELMRMCSHIDDQAVTCSSDALYDDVFAIMKSKFVMTDYDGAEMDHYLGIGVARQANGDIHLSQTGYITEILDRLNLEGSAGALSPEKPGSSEKLQAAEGEMGEAEQEFMSTVPYKGAVGALFYLARATRPDIVHAVGQVGKFMARPTALHWEAVLRIYRYLKRTMNTPLVMRKEVGAWKQVEGYADADWCGDKATSKSHTGWIVFAGGSPVAWHSKQQSCISQSSTEAEYVGVCSLSNELAFWLMLAADMGEGDIGPLDLWCDNASAVQLADHPGKFSNTKHIEMKFHVVRKRQVDKQVIVRWCPNTEMLADIFTKNAAVSHFRKMASRILGSIV